MDTPTSGTFPTLSDNDTIEITVTDSGGNAQTGTVGIDTTPPTLADIPSNDPTPTLTGTGEPGEVLTVEVDADGDGIPEVTYSVTVAADGTWSVNPDVDTPTSGTFPVTDEPGVEMEISITDPSGNKISRTVTVGTGEFFAFDSLRNHSTDQLSSGSGNAGMRREIILSAQLTQMASEPILTGTARPGSVIVGRIYTEDRSIVDEVSSQAGFAGNWFLNFAGANVSGNFRIVVEHVETKDVELGNSMFTLGEKTYQAFQMTSETVKVKTANSILSNSPSNSLENMSRQNSNPLNLL